MAPALLALLGVWLGQRINKSTIEKEWRLTQKLEVYRQLFRAVSEYSLNLADSIEIEKCLKVDLKAIKKQDTEIAENFHAALSIAPLFISSGSLKLIEEVRPTFFSHAMPYEDFDVDGAENNLRILRKIRDELIVEAKADLKKYGVGK